METIHPPVWSVSVTRHERWEWLSPADTRRRLVGYEWRFTGEVSGVSLPREPGYCRFTLRRPGRADLQWLGVWQTVEIRKSPPVTYATFSAVDDGTIPLEEFNCSSSDPGCTLEFYAVRVDRSTGELVREEAAAL